MSSHSTELRDCNVRQEQSLLYQCHHSQLSQPWLLLQSWALTAQNLPYQNRGKQRLRFPRLCVKFHLMTNATNTNAAFKPHFGEQPVLCYLLVHSLAKGMLGRQQGSTYTKGNKNCYLDSADLSSSPSVCNVILSPPFPRDFLKRHVCKQSVVILIGMRLHHNLMER